MKNKELMGAKTTLQAFADFLAQDKGDRGAVYELTTSESTFVLFRRKDKDGKL